MKRISVILGGLLIIHLGTIALKNIKWYTQDSINIISPAGTGWNDVADLNR